MLHDRGKSEFVLSFDFDGTLVGWGEHPPIDAGFFDRLKQWKKEKPVSWGINTGRSIVFALRGIEEADIPLMPDFLIVRERDIFYRGDDGQWVPDIAWNAASDAEHHALFHQHEKQLLSMKQWVEDKTAAMWGVQENEPAGIVASTASEMDWILKNLKDTISRCDGLSYQRNGIYLRFSHQDYHKGTAMAEVAKKLGVSRNETFAMGDGHNDLDMLDLRYAQHIACPSNACSEVKEHVKKEGGFIASNPSGKGAREALDDLHRKISNA